MRHFLTLLVVLFLIVAGVGWYRGWFTMGLRNDSSDDKVDVNVSIDRAKIRSDTQAAQERTRELGERVTRQAREVVKSPEEETARGNVIDVLPEMRQVRVRLEDGVQTFEVPENSTVRLQAKSGMLEQLKPGDRVTVIYQMKDGKRVARSLTVEPDA
jgi:translation initiation factor IF-1